VGVNNSTKNRFVDITPNKYSDRAVCLVCWEDQLPVEFKMGKWSSTSSLRRHLMQAHRTKYEKMLAEEEQRGHTGKRTSAASLVATSSRAGLDT